VPEQTPPSQRLAAGFFLSLLFIRGLQKVKNDTTLRIPVFVVKAIALVHNGPYTEAMIYLASDHRGFELKARIKEWLAEWGVAFEDCGPSELDPNDDYPDFVHVAAKKVAAAPSEHKAIVLGGTGQGEAMVCNRFKGVRAIVFYGEPLEIVRLGRLHNNANVLSIGAAPGNTIAEGKPMEDEQAKNAVKLFLETEFEPLERHVRRIGKIDQL
jgi:ribose 5-phosphate isomerase B